MSIFLGKPTDLENIQSFGDIITTPVNELTKRSRTPVASDT